MLCNWSAWVAIVLFGAFFLFSLSLFFVFYYICVYSICVCGGGGGGGGEECILCVLCNWSARAAAVCYMATFFFFLCVL